MKGKRRIFLASRSSRRLDLLRSAGIEPVVVAVDIDEDISFQGGPERLAVRLAELKAVRASEKLGRRYRGWILGADTVVFDKRGSIGKPSLLEESKRMIERLSGRAHWVVTGYCVLAGDGREGREMVKGFRKTKVYFRKLFRTEIEKYVASREGMDKAGAYGIQEGAAGFVKAVEGSYTNVVGLPLAEVVEALRKLGAEV